MWTFVFLLSGTDVHFFPRTRECSLAIEGVDSARVGDEQESEVAIGE